MLPRFAQSLGGNSLASLSRWRMLSRFAQSLGGCSLASLSHWGMLLASLRRWGDAPSLRFVAGGTLPNFAQSLIYLLHHFAQSQIYAPSLRSVAGGCSLASLCRFPFNGSIKLLQNLHSRGSMKQHFYVWEPHCGYLRKVKRANGTINMHSKGSNESLPKY